MARKKRSTAWVAALRETSSSLLTVPSPQPAASSAAASRKGSGRGTGRAYFPGPAIRPVAEAGRAAADYPAQMQRNDFSLERLRQLREHDEQVAKEALAASLGQRLRGQAMLQHAQLVVSASQDATRTATNAPRSGQDLL